MAFLDFGLSEGLAYSYNANADMDAAKDQYLLKRQAQIDQENKAKLMGDMFQFGKAYDKYNEGRLNGFVQQRMTDIGKFVDENPDFQSNVGKWVNFKNMTRELLDNPIVSESMRIKSQTDFLNKYIADTPGAENLPDVIRMKEGLNNYLESGSTDRDPMNRKEFMFNNPDDLIDWNKSIADAFKNSEMHGLSKGAHGSSTIYSTDADLDGAVMRTKSSPDFYLIQKNFNSRPPAEQKYKTIEEWIRFKGQSFAPTIKYDKGWEPNMPGGRGSGFGQNDAGAYDTWDKLHQAAAAFSQQHGTKARFAFAPEATQTVFGTKDTNGNTQYNFTPEARVVSRNGDVFTDRTVILNGAYPAIPSGYIRTEVQKDKSGNPVTTKHFQGYTMEVPLTDAYKMFNEGNSDGMFNEKAPFEFDTGDLSIDQIEIRDKYKQFAEVVDHNGKPFVKFNVEQPYNPYTIGFSEAYNKIYNPSANKEIIGTSPEKYPGVDVDKAQRTVVAARQLISGKGPDESVQWFDGTTVKVKQVQDIISKLSQ